MRSNTILHYGVDHIHLAWLCGLLAFVELWPASVWAQVQTENGQVVARCGINVNKGEPFSFDAKGSLQTKHGGYFEGREGKTYTLTFQDDKGRKALLKCKGRIAWDADGQLTEGKDNFLALMTEAHNGNWYDIISAELEQGVLSFTATTGVYTDFSEKPIMVPTKRTPRVLVINQQGHLLGELSFILSGFSPSFNGSGTLSKDMRDCKVEKRY